MALRIVERDVRNLAAHQIVAVTKEWIKRKTGYEPEEIMKIIKNAVEYAGICVKKEDWKSYDAMNDYIEACVTVHSQASSIKPEDKVTLSNIVDFVEIQRNV